MAPYHCMQDYTDVFLPIICDIHLSCLQSFAITSSATIILYKNEYVSRTASSKRNYQAFQLWLSGLGPDIVSVKIWVRSLVSPSGLRTQCCCKLQHSSWIWLGSGSVVAVAQTSAAAPTKPPAQELPHASGAVLKRTKQNNNKKETKEEEE